MKSWICATCNRKNDLDAATCLYCDSATTVKEKPPYQLKRGGAIDKVGTNNKFFCSDGHTVTQWTINEHFKRLKEILNKDTVHRRCEGCGSMCTAYAHIIAKARCKVIRKTELIWDERNVFPACNRCNMAIENPKGDAWKRLLNKERCLEFIKENDSELYSKFIYSTPETI